MPEFPRSLTERERALLLMLLPEGAFEDVEIYRDQIEHARVVSRCPCGCPTINLVINRAMARRAVFEGNPLLPVEAYAGEAEDHLELILFARSGYLESLEISWIGNPPPELPAPDTWQLLNNAAPLGRQD